MSLPNALPPDLLRALRDKTETLWVNDRYQPRAQGDFEGAETMQQAAARLQRHADVMARIFPELREAAGQVQSPLLPLAQLQAELDTRQGAAGTWYLKCDHALPVAGSVKARGGFHEVLSFAERLLDAHAAKTGDAVPALDSAEARALFSTYTVAVGSTGNLGLGIGTISAALGFRAVVHMSSDAKQWKKDRLRANGTDVVEHAGDYARAVDAGRQLADSDPHAYFVDDEQSEALFLGYAVAADELAAQLHAAGRSVDAAHPLFVYLPCGVGGAPGGIAYGLKQRFGEFVHCVFAEPVASPCMLVQLASGSDAPLSVYDIGLDNRTEADGLAVGLASPLVAPLMRDLLAGVFTVEDDRLFRDIHALATTENVLIEPSAAAGFSGPRWLTDTAAGLALLDRIGARAALPHATHVLWSTGGALVPQAEHDRFQARGLALSTAAAH
ncbi:D-serine ammonia-lyase [Schauerella aestuarii]|uniref:D-serine ammonia-lyase n=1 Tax=Schauerella aestuarii TaxID=2511204 RepID=UPI00136988AE|nr:D-serine ammonia-lyase [Achromobacter aestuarii]MYZ44953.1 D-serine ammonia-lyase [Achromobacter aestuarii]